MIYNYDCKIFYTNRDAHVAGNITITIGKLHNVIYFVVVAYYASVIFFKICSESGDFPHFIEIALLFYLQLSQPDRISAQSGSVNNYNETAEPIITC